MIKRVGLAITSCIVAFMVCVFGTLSICADSYGNDFILAPYNKRYVEMRPLTWQEANYGGAEFVSDLGSYETNYSYTEVYSGSIENGYPMSGEEFTTYTQVYDLVSYAEGFIDATFYLNQNVMFNEVGNQMTGFFDYVDIYWTLGAEYYYTYPELLTVQPYAGTYDEEGNVTYWHLLPMETEIIGTSSENVDAQYSQYTTLFRSRLTAEIPFYNWYGFGSAQPFNLKINVRYPGLAHSFVSVGLIGGYLGVSDFGWYTNPDDINWEAVYNRIPDIDLIANPIIDGGKYGVSDLVNLVWGLPVISNFFFVLMGGLLTFVIIKFAINKGAKE